MKLSHLPHLQPISFTDYTYSNTKHQKQHHLKIILLINNSIVLSWMAVVLFHVFDGDDDPTQHRRESGLIIQEQSIQTS